MMKPSINKRINHCIIHIVLIISLSVTFPFLGCIDSEPEQNDLSTIALTSDDVDSVMEPFSEDHVTTPYIVEQGKLFEGMLVLEKYEIVFMKNASYFLVQQLAIISSEVNASLFLEMLRGNDTIPGLISDYQFETIPSETLGEESILKTTTTTIDGNVTQLYLLVIRKDDTVCILVSGSLSGETILSYGSILETRLMEWKHN